MINSIFEMFTEVKSRLSKIEENTSTLEEINKKLSNLSMRVEKSETEIGSMKIRIRDMESDLQGNSDIMDRVKAANDTVGRNITKMKKNIEALEKNENEVLDDVDELHEMMTELRDRATDAQCRSIKYNLIFSGIPEKVWDQHQSPDDDELTLKNFIVQKLKIEDAHQIAMANVHRIGQRDRRTGARPRSIIAKFVYYKDLVRVKRNAKELKGTHFGINEQFPKEIEDKRKTLYPVAKEERKQNKKTVFNRDQLYIDGVLYKSPDVQPGQPTQQPRTKRR
ncbi:uncharacterized protein LOC132556661 [Ylistrum balloti]|uniref:uncharacterized protein LOC132556661 n=1 Tax=Ylistrum balloti TaxID=509963 RepID=UPI002905B41D|nr:uncharacterized protein LOC132556661 [Ylistrum balloti]